MKRKEKRFSLMIFIGGFYLNWGDLYIAADALMGEDKDIPFGYFDLIWKRRLIYPIFIPKDLREKISFLCIYSEEKD